MISLRTGVASFRSIAIRQNPPLFDFLAPRFEQELQSRRYARHISTTSKAAVSAATEPGSETLDASTPNPNTTTSKPLTQAQRDFLTHALRVNQAGELAATLIYTAQTPPLVKAHPHLRPLMKHMYDQEAGHFSHFNKLLAKHRVRPTAMYPLWTVAANALGWSTAVMGREAAMACTEAVETEIGTHYNEQVRTLLLYLSEMENQGIDPGPELRDMVADIRRIRDEELEHLDHAVENEAKMAKPYSLLTGVIRAGCRGAIWLTERT